MRDESNLTQKQRDAKRAFLGRQQAQMLARFGQMPIEERKAFFVHINALLEVGTKEQRLFWLRFRQRLERLNEISF